MDGVVQGRKRKVQSSLTLIVFAKKGFFDALQFRKCCIRKLLLQILGGKALHTFLIMDSQNELSSGNKVFVQEGAKHKLQGILKERKKTLREIRNQNVVILPFLQAKREALYSPL